MIVKSIAGLRIYMHVDKLTETCCICDKDIPNGAMVIRKVENNNIICLICLTDIAEIEE